MKTSPSEVAAGNSRPVTKAAKRCGEGTVTLNEGPVCSRESYTSPPRDRTAQGMGESSF